MSIQLKNKLEQIFETKLSVTAFWTYATIKAYAKFLIEKLHLSEPATPDESSENRNSENSEIPPISNKKSFDNQHNQSEISDKNPENRNSEDELDELSRLLDDELRDL
jgi:hypothetical protein